MNFRNSEVEILAINKKTKFHIPGILFVVIYPKRKVLFKVQLKLRKIKITKSVQAVQQPPPLPQEITA